MEKVRELLSPLQIRPYRYLWIAQVLSELGDWAARLALSVLVLERTGSPALVGLALGLSLITWFGPGQLLASLVDRYGRRNVMVAADLVRGGAFLAMLIPGPTWVLLALAAFAGLATPAFEGARSAAQIEVVPKERYGASLALGAVTQDTSILIGYLFAGLTLAVAEPSTALAVNATTFLVSALLLTRLPKLPNTDEEDVDAGLRPAVRFLLTDRPVRRAALLTIAATFSGATAETLIVIFNGHELHGPRWVPGAILAAVTAVTLIATTRAPLKGSNHHLLRAAGWMSLIAAAAAAGLAFLGTWGTIAAFLVVGILYVVPIPTNIVAGPRFPQHLRAVAMSVVIGAMVGGQAIAATVAGFLAEYLGVAAAIAASMIPAIAMGAYSVLRPCTVEDEGGEDLAEDALDEEVTA